MESTSGSRLTRPLAGPDDPVTSTMKARTQDSMHQRTEPGEAGRRAAAAAAGLGAGGPARAGTDDQVLSGAFTSGDVGFSEGGVRASMVDEFDGMNAYAGANKPIVRVDLNWAHVEGTSCANRARAACTGTRSTWSSRPPTRGTCVSWSCWRTPRRGPGTARGLLKWPADLDVYTPDEAQVGASVGPVLDARITRNVMISSNLPATHASRQAKSDVGSIRLP
jgi:hypothetical protein